MEPCTACGEKRRCHTVTGAEKRCKQKKQQPTHAVLWHPANRGTHIKRKNPKKTKFLYFFCCFYILIPAFSKTCATALGSNFDKITVRYLSISAVLVTGMVAAPATLFPLKSHSSKYNWLDSELLDSL
jgi:hypothetical protein